MIRVRIKNDSLRFKVVIALIEKQFEIIVNNESGDCLYIWTDGNKRAEISHITSDNPTIDIGEKKLQWLLNCIPQ